MKIVILANCQGLSLSKCLASMVPQVEVRHIEDSQIGHGDIPDLSAAIAGADHVFAQASRKGDLAMLGSDKVTLFPVIAFPGFHPDMTYIEGVQRESGERQRVMGPVFEYHSGLVAANYMLGRSTAEAIASMEPSMFARCGYYDLWDEARRELLAEGSSVNFPLTRLFQRWEARSPFMYSANHPTLDVMADVARVLLEKIDLEPENRYPEYHIQDPMKGMPVWPVYPGIAEQHGLVGQYVYQMWDFRRVLLPEMVEESYRIYNKYDAASFKLFNVDFDRLSAALREAAGAPASREATSTIKAPNAILPNPYKGLPDSSFWRRSVAPVEAGGVDPVVNPRFAIQPADKVATAGSCFAQHLSRALVGAGFNYYVEEAAPSDMAPEEAQARNFGTFSARFGNIYTVRQLVQLIKRAYGNFSPVDEAWLRPDGRWVDPFRPQVEPDGFADVESVRAARVAHLAAVRRMLESMDYLVFTLGLTECWRSRIDGAVFPLAPGVVAGSPDPTRYEYHNFSQVDTAADLFEAIDLIGVKNPSAKIILTVSPVPLIATYEAKHVLVSTTYSKSALRAAANEAWNAFDNVEYFPSFEIITGNYAKGAFFAEDLREVTPEGVATVMGTFLPAYTGSAAEAVGREPAPAAKRSAIFDIVCDEEALAQ